MFPADVSEHSLAVEEALSGLVVRSEVGSTVHGVNIEASDRDVVYVSLFSDRRTLGLSEEFRHFTVSYKPYQHLDTGYYSLREYVRHAVDAEPNMLSLLFIDNPAQQTGTAAWDRWRSRRDWFLSTRVGVMYGKYVDNLKAKVLGLDTRAEYFRLEFPNEARGRAAGQAVRLCIQGCELLTTGHLTLPMEPEHASLVREIKRGDVPTDTVLTMIDSGLADLASCTESSRLPDDPRTENVEHAMIEDYLEFWGFAPTRLRAGQTKC